ELRGPLAAPRMRVLIVGAAGFAGRYLTRELLARGHDVFAATKSGGREEVLPAGRAGEGRPDALPDLPLLRCDVTVQAEVEAALAATRPDGVVFLAGLSAPAAASADP